MDNEERLKVEWPELYKRACEQDIYHVSEYADWFYLGLELGAESKQ